MSEVLVKSVAHKSMMFSNVTVDITFPRIKINMDGWKDRISSITLIFHNVKQFETLSVAP